MEEQILTAKEVAKLINRCRNSVYVMARDGVLPCIRVGGRWRFTRRAVDNFITWRSRFVTAEELAIMLRVSKTTIYTAIKKGSLKYSARIYREYLFDRNLMVELLEGKRSLTPHRPRMVAK